MRAFLALALAGAALSCSGEAKPDPVSAAEQKTDLEILQEELRADPRDQEAWQHLAALYDRAGQYQEEVDALTRLLALDPRAGYAHFKLGTALNRLERYQEAVASFGRAAKLLPRQPMVLNNMAFAYGKLGRTREQIAALQKAISLRPEYAIARFNLGMAFLAVGRRGDARKEQARLSEIDADLAAALQGHIDGGATGAPPAGAGAAGGGP